MSSSIVRKYGTPRDKPDTRDHVVQAPQLNTQLPPKVDLRPLCRNIPVYDQGELGSCTSQALGFVYDFLENRTASNPESYTPSRLFIYYNEREMEGTVYEDSGASIRDGVKSLNSFGVCPESMWPYAIDKFTDKPTPECYAAARNHRALLYKRLLQTPNALKSCLASGLPIVFGIQVFPSFSQAGNNGGHVPMPNYVKEEAEGGHAVTIVGYDDDKKVFIVRNSWGPNWGDAGYFYLPYDYVLDSNLAYDMWQISKVTEDTAPKH